MKKLRKFLKDNKITGPALARRLGVSTAAVYPWINGISVPSVVTAIKLDRLTRGEVSVYDWK